MLTLHWESYPHVAQQAQAREWITLLTHLQKAPKTVDAYARCLEDLLAFFEEQHLPVLEASRGELALYLNALHHRSISGGGGLALATIQQRLTVARLWYDDLIAHQYRQEDVNPVGRGSYQSGRPFAPHQDRGLLPRVKQQPWIPSDREWDRFLEVVFQEASLRTQAMVLLAYEGALRRSEVVAVGVADIDWPHDQITIRPETAKNASGRLIFYSEPTCDCLSAYMVVRQQVLRQSGRRSSPSLFLSESHRNPGCGLSVEMWHKIVQRLATQAQLPRFTTHTFRHLRLTDYARCKLELYEIALLAGHRSIESTRLYLHLSGAELGERVKQATQQIVATLTRKVQKARQADV